MFPHFEYNLNIYRILLLKFGLGTEKVAKLLIDNNADVNARELDGSTPLHWTSEFGNFQLICTCFIKFKFYHFFYLCR